MSKRIVALFAVMLFLFVCVTGKVYEVSVLWFAQTSQAQASRTVTVARSRGTLYDRNMQKLTNAQNQWKFCALGEPETMALLQQHLSADQLAYAQQRWEQGYPAILSAEHPVSNSLGLLQFNVPIRYQYPIPAQHLIGYLKEDGSGATGLELAFERQLSQAGGTLQVTYGIDGAGRILSGVQPVITDTLSNATAGIALTLDVRIQQAVEEICQQLLPKGAVLVMQPQTGHILSGVSCPSYRADQLAQLLDAPQSPLVNRLLSNYNVGSVFKIVSAAAALESGIGSEQTFACTGSVPVGAHSIRCHYRLGHGLQDMCEGFLHSCNPYFIQLVQQTGAQPLAYLARTLGFDTAVFMAPEYKTSRAVLPEDEQWDQPTVLAELSFGQGSLLATPVHIAQLIGAVVNDGQMIRPTLVYGQVDASGRLQEQNPAAPQQVFSAQTAQTLRQMMIATVEEGTGKEGRPDRGGAGGKTGTAETGWQTETGETMIQSWYAGFYPAQQPQFVVVVLSEDVGTTACGSAEVFRAVCNKLSRFL